MGTLRQAIEALPSNLQEHPQRQISCEGKAVSVLDSSRFNDKKGGVLLETSTVSFEVTEQEPGVTARQTFVNLEYDPLAPSKIRRFERISISVGSHPPGDLEHIGVSLETSRHPKVRFEINDEGKITQYTTGGPVSFHIDGDGQPKIRVDELAIRIPGPEEMIERISRAELGVDLLTR